MKILFVLQKAHLRVFGIVVLFLSVGMGGFAQQPQLQAVPVATATPLLFTENNGQVADINGVPQPNILFTTGGKGIKLFITATGIQYQFVHTQSSVGHSTQLPVGGKIIPKQEDYTTSIHRVAVQFVGANPNPQVVKGQPTPYVENFFLSHCPQGITNVNTYEKITLKNLYPGIDWVLYNNNGNLKYDLIVHPGANPAQIKIKYDGQDSLQHTPKGSLALYTSLGTLQEAAPVLYQGDESIAGKFKLNNNILSFNIGSYNKTQPLIIDPELIWGTFYTLNGTSSEDYGYDVTTDKENNVLMTGETNSTIGVAYNGYKSNFIGIFSDAFIVKFGEKGNRIWGTYFGGDEHSEYDPLIATDDSMNIYLAFSTQGTQLHGTVEQTTHSFDQYSEAFIAKFDKNCGYKWGRFYGGDDKATYIFTLTIDKNNEVIIGGFTDDKTGIAKNGYINDNSSGNYKGFFAKFSAKGSLVWGSYWGGWVYGSSVDEDNNVIISGYCDSTSPDIAFNGFKKNYSGGENDGFLAKFTPSGTILWSTYYGGEDKDYSQSCISDNQNNIYLYGFTKSKTGISFNGYKNTLADRKPPINYWETGDVFVAKFNAAGNRLWSTYFGGDSADFPYCCAINYKGDLLISGRTTDYTQNTFPVKDALKTTINSNYRYNYDAFLSKLDSSGQMVWSTLFGSDLPDMIYNVEFDRKGNVLAAGTMGECKNYVFAGNGFQSTFPNTDSSNGPFLIKLRDSKFYINDVTILSSPCPGNSVKIKYTALHELNGGNNFVFQLSDSAGSFTSPMNIASRASTFNGTDTITIVINNKISPGTGNKYRIRIISTDNIDTTEESDDITLENPKMNISFSSPQGQCAGDTTVLETNNHAGYTYQWYKDGTAITGAKFNTYTSTQPGSYFLFTFAPSGCWDYSDTLTVTPTSIIKAGFTGDTVSCTNTTLSFTDTTSNNIKRIWKSSFGDTSSKNILTHTFTNVASYWVTLVAENALGCKDSITKTITILTTPQLNLVADKDTVLCPNDSLTLTAQTESSNIMQWYKDNVLLGTNDSFIITNQKGEYVAKVSNTGGCSQTKKINVNIINTPTKGFISIKKNGVINSRELCTDDFEVLELSSELPGNVLWRPSNGTTPVLTVVDTGWVYLSVSTNSGCSFNDSVLILDGCKYTIYIPNAFTPGKKDDLNPVFTAVGTNITKFKMEIYSLWGEKIFETVDIYNGWDGKNKTVDCPEGLYIYLITYQGKTNKGFNQIMSTKGTITLIR